MKLIIYIIIIIIIIIILTAICQLRSCVNDFNQRQYGDINVFFSSSYYYYYHYYYYNYCYGVLF
jgi:hypothetical protein